jgi:hypothetical protein
MDERLKKLFLLTTMIIPPDEITVGIFHCSNRFGYTDNRVYRETDFADPAKKALMRGVLVFQTGLSKFVKNGSYIPWKRIDAVQAGPRLLCTFSLTDHFLRTDMDQGGITDRQYLPCALVHSFETVLPGFAQE